MVSLIDTVLISMPARRRRSTTVRPSISSKPSARKMYTFFAHFGFLLIDFFVKVSSYFLKWIIAFFVWSYNVCLELSASTISLVSSLSAMDRDMFHRLGFLSVLLWLYLPTWFLQEVYGCESHDLSGVESFLFERFEDFPWLLPARSGGRFLLRMLGC